MDSSPPLTYLLKCSKLLEELSAGGQPAFCTAAGRPLLAAAYRPLAQQAVAPSAAEGDQKRGGPACAAQASGGWWGVGPRMECPAGHLQGSAVRCSMHCTLHRCSMRCSIHIPCMEALSTLFMSSVTASALCTAVVCRRLTREPPALQTILRPSSTPTVSQRAAVRPGVRPRCRCARSKSPTWDQVQEGKERRGAHGRHSASGTWGAVAT